MVQMLECLACRAELRMASLLAVDVVAGAVCCSQNLVLRAVSTSVEARPIRSRPLRSRFDARSTPWPLPSYSTYLLDVLDVVHVVDSHFHYGRPSR